MGAEGAFEHLGPGELIAEGARAVGTCGGEPGDHLGVPPGEQAVEVAEGAEHFVVTLRADGNDLAGDPRHGADGGGELADPRAGADAFRIHHPCIDEAACDRGVGENPGDDQRAEKIALAAFVDAEVRFEACGVEDFLIAEAGLAEDFGFEEEAHEVGAFLPLDKHLGALGIHRHVEFPFPRGEERVGFFQKLEAAPGEDLAERRGLGGREGGGVTGQGRHVTAEEISSPGSRRGSA